MEIFISWSGTASRQIAEVLSEWLPLILQKVKPYFTPNDIEKGTKWDSEITGKLSQCGLGILCLTPDNTEKPWILFEAGALSAKLDKSQVCPLLFGISSANVSGPLATFQMTQFNQEDIRKLLNTINAKLGDGAISEKTMDTMFAKFYPEFEEKINEILDGDGGDNEITEPLRSNRELLEEILALARRNDKGEALESIQKFHLDRVAKNAVKMALSNVVPYSEEFGDTYVQRLIQFARTNALESYQRQTGFLPIGVQLDFLNKVIERTAIINAGNKTVPTMPIEIPDDKK